jgi:hypothetical protein
MNKTAIKNFAVWARRKLIADISYRAGLMGITEDGIKTALPQSTGKTEFYDIGTAEPYFISGEEVKQRKRLVEVIRQKEADTDYKTAYQYIIEEVAYTWFNRLIAVRFMEVNEYLPSRIRVLSSETGKVEPDLVTNPFDAELLFTEEEKQTVIQLKLNNQLDEVFRLLFIKQCNALNAILPNLFEKTNDYTELLLSLSVIDEEGVVYHLVHDIPESNFNVELEGQVEIIGWLYQYYNTEPKDAVFGRPSGQKIKKEEIPAATQLFTPDWIVRYMVENSLGRLWVEGHPNDEMKATWKYYLEEAPQEPAVQEQLEQLRSEYKNLNPEDIKVIDPCMGSGHILVYAFDVLMQIYEAQGYSQRDAAQSILRYNLHGLDIDERACQLAYFSVMMKARQYDRRILTRNIQPMVYATTGDEAGENFGSLVLVDNPGKMPEDPQNLFELADYEKRLNAWSYRYLLAQKYDVVVTNPPYMGGSGMNAALSEFVKENYPDSKSDMFAIFIERCREMTKPNGYQAMITQHAWMFLSSYEKLRAKLQTMDTVNMAHLGIGTFEDLNSKVVQSVAFVTRKSHVAGYKGCYNRLFEKQGLQESNEDKATWLITGKHKFEVCQDNFSKIPGSPVAYWVSEALLNIFVESTCFRQCGKSLQGTVTGDNERFMRLWYEVNTRKMSIFHGKVDDSKWVPYSKGGEFRRWYGNMQHVINWENDGYEIRNFYDKSGKLRSRPQNTAYFFKEGITWSSLTSGLFGARYLSDENTFSDIGPLIILDNPTKLNTVLGYINSKVFQAILDVSCTGLHYQNGVVAGLPCYIDSQHNEAISELVEKCKEISRDDWDSFETSWDFQRHPLV